MFSFKSHLTEAVADEEKLTHLEHLEDHIINAGSEGFDHAFNNLTQVHSLLNGKKTDATITTKFDGSPSVIFGHHPETGKFFVASKSVFNKNPKLNYNIQDIVKNHGHAPGLVSKLTHALIHLPKITPPGKVYQGDLMYSKDDGDVKEDRNNLHFKPNTITYSVKKGTEEAKKINNAKLGVAIHTAYSGPSLDQMKVEYNADTGHLINNPDTHILKASFDPKKATHTPEAQEKFNDHLSAAVKEHNKLINYEHQVGHEDRMKEYINQTVRNSTTPNTADYRNYLKDWHGKQIDKVKTTAAKERKTGEMNNMINHVDDNKSQFDSSFKIHHHLQKAKDALVQSMAGSDFDYKHSINGKAANIVTHNIPSIQKTYHKK
ncbi:MAG: hypothetical protein EB127_11255 [Alphaproteobacteria bacterium]|nr:hypothetical protein [Alphaproteobacteria bacterium]